MGCVGNTEVAALPSHGYTVTWRETREPGCGLCSLCGPGGAVPGYVSRLSAARSLVFVSSLGRTYDSWHRIIFIYQGHTIEERWTSIVVTVILLSSSLAGPLLIHVSTSSIVVGGTCDKISQYTIP
jgi:hypothetical protein